MSTKLFHTICICVHNRKKNAESTRQETLNWVSMLSHQPTVLSLLVLCPVSITQQVAVSERLRWTGLVPIAQLCII